MNSKRLFELFVARRWWVIAAVLVLCGAMVPLVMGLDPGPLPNDSEQHKTFERFKKQFPGQDRAITILWKQPKLDYATYRQMADLAEAMKKEGLTHVAWFGNSIAGLKFDDEKAFTLAPLKKVAGELSYSGVLWNPAQDVYLFSGVVPEKIKDVDGAGAKVLKNLGPKVKALAAPGRTVKLLGGPTIRARYLSYMGENQRLFLGGGLVLALVLFLILGGCMVRSFMSLLPFIPAVLVLLGVLSALGVSVEPLTLAAPVVALILLFGATMTLMVPIHLQLSEGKENREAVVDTFASLFVPSLLAAVAGAAVLATLTLTGIHGLGLFGFVAAGAILLTWLFTMLLLPALFSLFGGKGFGLSLSLSLSGMVAGRGGKLSKTTRWVPVGVAVVLAGLSVFGLTRLCDKTYMVDDIRASHPIRQDLKWVEAQGLSTFRLDIFVENLQGPPLVTDEVEGFIRRIEKTAAAYPSVRKVLSVNTITDTARKLLGGAKGMSGDVLLSMAEMQGEKVKGFIATFLNRKARSAHLVVAVTDPGSLANQKLLADLDKVLATAPKGTTARTTGSFVNAQKAFPKKKATFVHILLAILALVLVLIMLYARSLMGLWAFVAAVPPLLVVAGLHGLIGARLTGATLLVLMVGFAIVAANVVHTAARVVGLIRGGMQCFPAVLEAQRLSGRGQVLGALVLLIGFAPMLASGYLLVFNLGLAAMVGALFSAHAGICILSGLTRKEIPSEE